MEKERIPVDEPPPFFKSWMAWYAMVLGTLAVVIVLLVFLSHTFR